MWGRIQMNCWRRRSSPANRLVLCSCFAWMNTDRWTMGSVADPSPVILSLNRAASVSPCSVGRLEFILLVTLDEWKSKINPHPSWTHTHTHTHAGELDTQLYGQLIRAGLAGGYCSEQVKQNRICLCLFVSMVHTTYDWFFFVWCFVLFCC